MRIAKNQEILDETNGVIKQRTTPHAELKDYSLSHDVSIEWEFSQEADRERMFILRVDDYEVILDYEEFLKAGRFI